MSNSRVLATELPQHIGSTVQSQGWIHQLRLLGKIAFLIMRDRSGLFQVVIEDKQIIEQLKPLQIGTVMSLTGKVAAAKTELGVEIVTPKISIISSVTTTPPIEFNKDLKDLNIETLLDYRAISLRNPRSQAIFKIQAQIAKAYREFLTAEGFTEFFGPNIISASSEGGSELFTVNYFDHEAKLSQSAQLYKQMMVGVYERVFAMMKCFRAEKSATRRHLTEATQFEFEMGFIEDFSEVMDMLERVVKYIVSQINQNCARELAVLGNTVALAPEDVSFPRIKFKEALELYYQRTGIDERNEIDLSPGAEKELCKYAHEEFGTDFIFVTNFLRQKTAFYAMPNGEDPTVTNYFDLLCREIEIVSGGQRIHQHDQLVESLELKGLNPADFADYLSIFKHGMPPHGGFGMGFERLTMMLLGLENIRESTLFPSDTKRVAGVSLAGKIVIGAENVRNTIIAKLSKANIDFKHIEHEATPTSADSARIRGTDLHEGVKALIVVGKQTKKNFQINVPADKQVDLTKVATILGEEVKLEKPELISDRFGLKIGGVPPFGNLIGIRNLFDNQIPENTKWSFNCGFATESITIASSEWFKIAEAEFGDFIKD